MHIEFPESEWRCGNGASPPDSIRVQSIKQAERILSAIARAISEPGLCVALMVTEYSRPLRYVVRAGKVSRDECLV